MERIVLTKSLFTELRRCTKSFVMSLFYHEFNNEALTGRPETIYGAVSDEQQALFEEMDAIQRMANQTGGIMQVECQSNDPFEKVARTMDILNSGQPCVVQNGALEANWIIVPFSMIVVREDGMWEVYYVTSKTVKQNDPKRIAELYDDAAPLLKVLSDGYYDRVAAFFITGINSDYVTGYPDPVTGIIEYDGSSALASITVDLSSETIADYVGGYDPTYQVEAIQNQLAQDPFWIPDVMMGSQCNNPYTCPFKEYCLRYNELLRELPANDAKKLMAAGYDTMEAVMDLTYYYPTLSNIPSLYEDKTFNLSDQCKRELLKREQIAQMEARGDF